VTDHGDPFRDLVAATPAPSPEQVAKLVAPLRRLEESLRANAEVDASVRVSDDGLRYDLVVWPLHRPAVRSTMVSIVVSEGRLIALNKLPWERLPGPEALESWLIGLVKSIPFREKLEDLRVIAGNATVEARLRHDGPGSPLRIQVLPAQQAKLGACALNEETELDFTVSGEDPLPASAALRQINSAGLAFDIREATQRGRALSLKLIRR
jgi:hypothetical protein